MMKIAVTALVSVVMLSSCATSSPMPDETYQKFGRFAAGTQRCFEAGHINAQLYADSTGAVHALLGTWTYDEAKMRRTMDYMYRDEAATPQTCRQIEAAAYSLISQATQHRANVQANRREMADAMNKFNNSIRKPIYCDTIGTMTMCN
ncbi:MAG: hypothetical protein A3E79_17220 [Burkholderiales bacterium RIFCSPHIGHO2_12_FULL_61_11]|nr:MAG: hypothetical protein A3E79_17220 [Burkholderiales bacterium RIFCSPHIGHO2_12_FULL_61_11]